MLKYQKLLLEAWSFFASSTLANSIHPEQQVQLLADHFSQFNNCPLLSQAISCISDLLSHMAPSVLRDPSEHPAPAPTSQNNTH